MAELLGREFWLRHTDKHGNSFVREHRVWDADVFLRSQQDAARKEGGRVDVITEDQYRAQR